MVLAKLQRKSRPGSEPGRAYVGYERRADG
jgi:hypothetical protein